MKVLMQSKLEVPDGCNRNIAYEFILGNDRYYIGFGSLMSFWNRFLNINNESFIDGLVQFHPIITIVTNE